MQNELRYFLILSACSLMVGQGYGSALAHNNQVSIKNVGNKRCIQSNGLPNHATGRFPNSGNPNSIAKQNIHVCVTRTPHKGKKAKFVHGAIGIGINGIQFRPGTADYYDPSSPRSFSRNRRSGWNLDGLGARNQLGMDQNNAHVDERGLYHYHGIATALVNGRSDSLIGWAADGFEIHYIGNKARSSYKLKKGKRPNGPGGTYDGTYVQDWRYVAGSGSLDQCNGGTLNGKYVYFATHQYPFLPHCLWGKISADFQHKDRPRMGQLNRQGGPGPNVRQGQQPRRNAGFLRGPPQEAIMACQNRRSGASCRFKGRRIQHTITGQCLSPGGQGLVCVPNNRP